jgi:hypothetical protein
MKDLFKEKVTDDCGELENVDLTKPFIKVMAFKIGGKWYDTKITNLTQQHIEIINSNHGYELEDMMRNAHDEVKEYCPLISWDSSCFFVVEAYGVEGFCQRLILSKDLENNQHYSDTCQICGCNEFLCGHNKRD